MADKPQSGEAELAIYLGSKIADSLVGATADRFITGPVLNLLGIKKTDNSAAVYHQDIVQRLSALGQSLDDHIRFEERVLFPAVEAALEGPSLGELGHELLAGSQEG